MEVGYTACNACPGAGRSLSYLSPINLIKPLLCLVLLQQLDQPLLIMNRHACLLRLHEFGAGVFTDDQVVEVFAHAGGNRAAQAHQGLSGSKRRA